MNFADLERELLAYQAAWPDHEFVPSNSDASLIKVVLALLGELPDRRRPTHRHKARGTTYRVVAKGALQCSANPALDNQPVVIYRGEDGRWWVRGVVEFEDGRFEEIEP